MSANPRNLRCVLQALVRRRCALLLLVATGCGFRTSPSEFDSASSGGLTDAGGIVGTAGTAEAGSAYHSYVWVVIQDTEPTNCNTSAPGAEIDAVALWNLATNTALGWGKAGTAEFWPNPSGNACENNDCSGDNCRYAVISNTFLPESLVSWTEGPNDAKVATPTVSDYSEDYDSGYLSLNGGKLQMQIGNAVDGTGPAQSFKSGDYLKVFEVDQTYITSGNAPSTCYNCLPKHYTVAVQTTQGTYLPLKPIPLAAENTTCSVLTAASTEGCGTIVFMVP